MKVGVTASPEPIAFSWMDPPLMALPWAPYPATICDERTVADNATVAFRGNRYSVPPGLWGVEAILDSEGVGRYRTPQLPITIAS